MSIKICPSCYIIILLILLVHSRKCDTIGCIGILAFEGQSKGLLVMKSHCILYEVLRHHMHQFLLGRLVGWYTLINPRRMREGYCSRSVCVCVCLSVCYHANCYIPRLRVQIAML